MRTDYDNLVDGIRAVEAVENAEREEFQFAAEEKLRSTDAGTRARLTDFDVAEMERDAFALDGTLSNQYALDNTRAVGRRDASTGRELAGVETEDMDLFAPIGEVTTSEFGIAAGGVGHAVKAVGETALAAGYNTVRGVVNFAADVAQFIDPDASEGEVFRMPTYEEAGGSAPQSWGDELAREAAGWVVGFNKVNALLRNVVKSPYKSAAASGVATDVVMTDPDIDTAMVQLFDQYVMAENDFATRAQMEQFYDENPLAKRGLTALEGAAYGVLLDGGMRALRRVGKPLGQVLYKMGDSLEETAVMGLAKSTHAPGMGLDADGQKYLALWMGARIMKGQTTMGAELFEALADTGATQAQMYAAWNQAARASQQARMQATERWLSEMNERWVLFHGSAHRFHEFDAEKINTGEGTQMEGYGLYLSEVEDVADSYRIAGHNIPPYIKRRGYKAEDPTPTYLYTASIDPAERANFAEWELPASKQKQAPALRRIAKEYGLDETTIDENFDVYYRALQRAVARRTKGEYNMLSRRAAKEASRVLRDEAGIKGWTYRENIKDAIGYGPDEMGTNVVLTDPSIARIDRREQRKALRGD